MQHVYAVCLCCMSVRMSMLHAQCYMPHALCPCPCSMYILLVHAACLSCMSKKAICQWCIFMLDVSSACPCFISMSPSYNSKLCYILPKSESRYELHKSWFSKRISLFAKIKKKEFSLTLIRMAGGIYGSRNFEHKLFHNASNT
jgi:hypothetical protein